MRFIQRVFAFGLVLGAAVAASADSVTLFNTGVDASGNPLADGTIGDPHYSLVSAPSGSTTDIRVRTSAGGYPVYEYLADDSSSAWIGPNNDPQIDGPPGLYDYQTTFFAPSAGTVDLTGLWAVDNEGVAIDLNGVDTGNSIDNNTDFSFQVWSSFTIDDSVNAGLNTLDFIVNNDSGPTGLRVEFSDTSFTPAGVPEINSASLGSLALIVLGALALFEGAKARREPSIR
jgi:hypothetical protein